MKTIVRSWLVLVIVGLAACGDDSPTAPTTPSTTPTTPATPATGNLTVTLSSIQSEVFNPSCVVHHGATVAEADLDLSEGRSFANLVNVMSTQVGLELVEPNDAENSYLIHKLDGRAGIVGARMPPNGPFLTDEALDLIKQWIDEGAQDN
ncbi:MAG: hypothetical protein OXG72_14305 [Acidobacteria bacterium]|nr:hypothetical protein [Acidobacteriota bacterium]